MFDKLFSKKSKKPETQVEETGDLQMAFAALLVEAARADETYDDRERAIIDKSLAAKFGLNAANAAALRAKGEAAQASAIDIQRFTRTAKEMPESEKIAFIEQLWEIVLSDGERDPFEDTLIRRVCGLIYVEDRLSGQARARVEARLGPA